MNVQSLGCLNNTQITNQLLCINWPGQNFETSIYTKACAFQCHQWAELSKFHPSCSSVQIRRSFYCLPLDGAGSGSNFLIYTSFKVSS